MLSVRGMTSTRAPARRARLALPAEPLLGKPERQDLLGSRRSPHDRADRRERLMTTPTIPASAVQVVTDHYEWSHGKRPRGEGSWAFFMQPPGHITDVNDPEQVFWTHGKYSEAKYAAQILAAARRQYVVWVAP